MGPMKKSNQLPAACLGLLVALGFATACGDSFTPTGAKNAGVGGGGAETSTTSGSGGASSTGTAGSTATGGNKPAVKLPCGAFACTEGQVCCIWPTDPDNESFCAAPGLCGAYLPASCTKGDDCAAGQVCCLVSDAGAESSIACTNSCTGDLLCSGDPTVCTDPEICVEAKALPDGYEICITPSVD